MALRHDAFISYSHAADGVVAPAVERALERLARPMFRLRALDVFRDQTSLSASPTLWRGIVAHLEASRWFLLFASPASAASVWCGRELDWWLQERSAEHLLIVLTEGEIAWDAARRDFDWTRTSALARTLSGRLADEPLYADLRWARELPKLHLDHAGFREAIVGIAAPLHGVARDQLDGDDVRRLARARWSVRGGVAAISLAAAVAGWQAVVATQQRAAADAQRARAEEALAAAQRDLLRARTAELRSTLQRLERLAANATGADAQAMRRDQERLRQRIAELNAELQSMLARQVGFRGDLGFLMRWEGVAGGVRLDALGATIDPATSLANADPDVIRRRYETLLSPDELEGVLALVGRRGADAKEALENNPVVRRIELRGPELARLVPEVTETSWLGLLKQYPFLRDPETPAAVQTALLSLAFNVGLGNVGRGRLEAVIRARDWPALADFIEGNYWRAAGREIPGLRRRRAEEAVLIRNALAAMPAAPGASQRSMPVAADR